jgi:E-phenylitaconyl-CoA hydratase
MAVNMQVEGSVAFITLARPEAMNALNIEALKALRQHLVEFRDRDDLRVCVLSGEGPKAFCAGADLKGTVASTATYPEAMFRSLEQASEQGLYIRLMDLSDLNIWKPTIAAINGYCLGGGLELALQCDIRVASTTAKFGLPEAAVASVPAISGLHRLLKAVPPAHAMKMALTGKPIDARKAQELGLVSDLYEPASLMEEAHEIARQVAKNGPLAVQACKRLARQTAHLSDADAQQLTEMVWGVLRDTQDRQEGRKAFSEKREPRYVGR